MESHELYLGFNQAVDEQIKEIRALEAELLAADSELKRCQVEVDLALAHYTFERFLKESVRISR